MQLFDPPTPLHVISLEGSIARRDSFIINNRHVGYEFFSAIDGESLDDIDINDSNYFIQPLSYSLGAYGCALSHLSLWRECILIDKPITILEDDVILRFDFSSRVRMIIDSLPSDWDIIHWGWNFDAPLSIRIMNGLSPVSLLFDQDIIREGVAKFQACKEDAFPYRLEQIFGTPAYSLSPKGAKKLKSICFPIRDFKLESSLYSNGLRNNGIDIVMNQIYGLIDAYVCFPPLAITPNNIEESTIAKRITQSGD